MFDGYSDNPSTRDCAHIRRSGGTIGVTVHFISSMALQTKKEEFLSNKYTIAFVQTALTSAVKQETVLVGEDTDMLVLLIYHAKNVRHNVFFRPETRRASQKGNRCWNIQCDPFLEVLSLTT